MDNASKKGFTLIELMIVIAIIAFLAALSIPTFSKIMAKTKRTEAYINLHAIYTAQKAYWAEHGTYTTQLYGSSGAGWQPEGYHGGGADEQFYYTYGFSDGTEGQAYFTGKLETSATFLTGTKADKTSFIAYAVGDIDGDGQPDILSIDQNNVIKIVRDDFQD
jgi:prepilin-type N-terminal cleavage/methylation domain-containing protein